MTLNVLVILLTNEVVRHRPTRRQEIAFSGVHLSLILAW